MGKAAKQNANRLKRQLKNFETNVSELKQDPDFISMIEAMEPEKPYRCKKGNKLIFGGKQFTGQQWKDTFLPQPEPQENDTTGN